MKHINLIITLLYTIDSAEVILKFVFFSQRTTLTTYQYHATNVSMPVSSDMVVKVHIFVQMPALAPVILVSNSL